MLKKIKKLHHIFKKHTTVLLWYFKKKPAPPPQVVKQKALKNYAKKHRVNIFIETGTYYGDTTWAMRKFFKKLYSIELSEELFKKAEKRFEKFENIEILHGDSREVLSKVLPQIKEPALFWLDGHYSGGVTAKGDKECPILEELDAIFSSNFEHIILIDDARCFIGQNDYPTISELRKFVFNRKSNLFFEVKDDIIRIRL
jgi:hypothetical protein